MASGGKRSKSSEGRFTAAMKDGNGERSLKVRAVGRTPSRITDFYHQLLRFTWPQLMLLFTIGFVGLNLIFAALYSFDPNGVSRSTDPVEAPLFWQSFFFSVHTVATIGYGNVYPVSLYDNILVVIEITLGVLFFALATGIAFARFSRPTARVLFSQVAVVSQVGGAPTLMFRAANQRHNMVFEARAIASVLMDEEVDGVSMRRFHDLVLVRSSTPVFALTWTIMHQIDDASPLASSLQRKALAPDAEIVVVLSGTDGRTGQTIHARWGYSPGDIRWNSRFVDILGQDGDGTRTIDYDRFHEIEEHLPITAKVTGS
jgi:inward rectifier potassium channel